MITLEGEYKEVIGPNTKFKLETNKGINFTLSDDKGVIMTLQSSQQPSTTVMRTVVHGRTVVSIGGTDDEVSVDGRVTLKRV